jgi:deoxyribodipyrimidine photo-lyase
MKKERIRTLKEAGAATKSTPVVYWMSRDQRISDNWALVHAQELADQGNRPLLVVFTLVSKFLGAKRKQFDFMEVGLAELTRDFAKLNIPFTVLHGEPETTIPQFCNKVEASVLVMDFSPLRINREWKKDVVSKVNCGVVEVDAHNVIPAFFVSDKKEFAAYTIRPKVHKHLKDFLDSFPEIKVRDAKNMSHAAASDHTTPKNPYSWIEPGEKAAKKALEHFISNKLPRYHIDHNDPSLDGQSNLSPYLHFGMISAQRVAQDVLKADAPHDAKEAFIEELVVRRELAENFCLYEPNYDSPLGFPDWAKKTHTKHADDKREYTYDLATLESAKTHDEAWNAAQREMINTGKMHGYMRMYWAKKILEWTPDVETAMKAAIYLNDTYELDGRDPNGYTGIAWSLGGVHDRAWFERSVFGQVRYMNEAGLKRKFDLAAYIKKNSAQSLGF